MDYPLFHGKRFWFLLTNDLRQASDTIYIYEVRGNSIINQLP